MRQTANISNKLINENKTNNNQPLSGDSTHRWHASSTSIIINNKENATLAGQNVICHNVLIYVHVLCT
jgi:hypothetical protein